MKIKNLKVYRIDENNGSLDNYDKNATIEIINKEYSISHDPEILYKIFNFDKTKYTEHSKKIQAKNVYKIRDADNNNEEICISLNNIQNIKFNIIKFVYKINITKILAWVGGILSTILTIKEIFN